MGIRFYCPSGHKLNVKSFLAGKKGFCPQCNEKVDIPLNSTRPSSRADAAGGASFPVATPVSVSPLTGASAAQVPMAMPVTAASAAEPASAPAMPVSAPTMAPTMERPPTPMADPVAEDPHAIWYVRPNSGGQQYGPAEGELFRQWIDEGRVAADSHIWRDDWPDWQRASETLPCFAEQTKLSPPKLHSPPVPQSIDSFGMTPDDPQAKPLQYESQSTGATGASTASMTDPNVPDGVPKIERRTDPLTIALVCLLVVLMLALIPWLVRVL